MTLSLLWISFYLTSRFMDNKVHFWFCRCQWWKVLARHFWGFLFCWPLRSDSEHNGANGRQYPTAHDATAAAVSSGQCCAATSLVSTTKNDDAATEHGWSTAKTTTYDATPATAADAKVNVAWYCSPGRKRRNATSTNVKRIRRSNANHKSSGNTKSCNNDQWSRKVKID